MSSCVSTRISNTRNKASPGSFPSPYLNHADALLANALHPQVPAPGEYTPLGTRTEQVRRVRGGLFLQKDGQTFVDQAARRARDIPGPLGLCLCMCVCVRERVCVAVSLIPSLASSSPSLLLLFYSSPSSTTARGTTLMQCEMPLRLDNLLAASRTPCPHPSP